MREIAKRLRTFLFPIESDAWLSILRIGTGLQVVLYCLSMRAEWSDLFSVESAGPIKRDLTEAILSADSHFIPRIGWIVDFGAYFGLPEQIVLTFVWWGLLTVGLGLLGGLFCRASAITAAFLHLCAVKSSGALAYGADSFTMIGLFYLMIAPLPDSLSLDRHLRGLEAKHADLNGFFRRALQVHLSLIYFFSGIAKCAGAGWWNGESIWRAMIRPPFNAISPHILIHWKILFPAVGISVCVLETAYPIFIWLRKTRLAWLVAILAMHIGIGLAMGMYLFALIMIILNMAAFAPPFLWRQNAAVSVLAEEDTA